MYVIFVYIFLKWSKLRPNAFFLPIRNFFFFFNWEILVKKFVDSYLESSWKHVVNSIQAFANLDRFCQQEIISDLATQIGTNPKTRNIGLKTMVSMIMILLFSKKMLGALPNGFDRSDLLRFWMCAHFKMPYQLESKIMIPVLWLFSRKIFKIFTI